MRISGIEQLDVLRESFKAINQSIGFKIKVCGGSGCRALGSQKVYDAFIAESKKESLNIKLSFDKCEGKSDEVHLFNTGCQGLCQAGPLVTVELSGFHPSEDTPQTDIVGWKLSKTDTFNSAAFQNIVYTGVKPKDVATIEE